MKANRFRFRVWGHDAGGYLGDALLAVMEENDDEK